MAERRPGVEADDSSSLLLMSSSRTADVDVDSGRCNADPEYERRVDMKRSHVDTEEGTLGMDAASDRCSDSEGPADKS